MVTSLLGCAANKYICNKNIFMITELISISDGSKAKQNKLLQFNKRWLPSKTP
jgi:hypothetical protein